MSETYALHEGPFGRAVVLELGDSLVAHSHSDTQLAFWLGGSRVEARVGSQVVSYSAQVALGTNSFESHDARLLDSRGPAIFLVLYISKPWLDKRRSITGSNFRFSSPGVPIDAEVRQSCWRVLDKIVSAQSSSDIDDEVEQLLRTAINAADRTLDCRAPVLDRRLRAAITYMREHVDEPIVVRDVASKVGLSRAHFFSLFREQLKTTPQVFWSAVRVEEAVNRLVYEKMPLTSVALDLGFSTPGNFSRFFREHMGVSPSRFRRVASESESHLLTGVPSL